MGPPPPVLGLDDPVLMETVPIGHRGGLVDQGGPVTEEHRSLVLQDRLAAHPKAQVGLPCPRGGHDQLVLVPLAEPLPKGFMRCDLKATWRGKSIVTLTRR
jgi:hypothetical protein